MVLGGTFLVNDWYPHPRPETSREILARAIALMPELAPPTAREASQPPTVADIEPLVIEHGCGLRPARKGGIRLESGMVQVDDGTAKREVPVVYNYGCVHSEGGVDNKLTRTSSHGGAGYQASWGTACAAAKLLEDILI